jgi:hypothetical protein
MIKDRKWWVIRVFGALAICLLALNIRSESIYDAESGTVKVDSILFNGTLYKNTVIVPDTLISIGAGLTEEQKIKTNLPATYSAQNGHLALQNTTVGNLIYSDLVITIKEALSYDSSEFVGSAQDYSDRTSVILNYLAASDVSQSRIDATLEWTKRVTDDWFKKESPFWKYYQPIDIWLVGSDPETAAALNLRACERLQNVYPARYLRDACNPESGSGLEFAKFDDYVNGGAAINSSVTLDGYHWMYFGPSGDDNLVNGLTVAHETWHMWQLAHLDIQGNEWVKATGLTTGNSSDRESIQNILMGKETGSLEDWSPIRTENSKGKGPFERDGTWWFEGAADYNAYLWYSKQPEAKALAENDEEREDYLQYHLSKVIEDYVPQFRETGLKVYELAYEHGNLGYKIGFLFHAFLVKEVGLDRINNGFWSEVAKLGFDSAFLKYFDKTYQEYGLEFEALVQKPKSEIISLLL